MPSKIASERIKGATVTHNQSLLSIVDKSVYSSNNSVSHVVYCFLCKLRAFAPFFPLASQYSNEPINSLVCTVSNSISSFEWSSKDHRCFSHLQGLHFVSKESDPRRAESLYRGDRHNIQRRVACNLYNREYNAYEELYESKDNQLYSYI